MTQPTLNKIPIGRYQKIQLYNIIIKQERKIQTLLYLYGQSTRINKKNLESQKKIIRSLTPQAEPNPLEDK